MDARRQIVGFSDHCRERMAQRNVTEADVRFVMTRGVLEHRTGVICFTIPRRCIPSEERSMRGSLESLVVLVQEGWVITVYRNRRPLRHIRHKVKYNDARLSSRSRATLSFAETECGRQEQATVAA
jgi:hypothetical protein